tara:strand:- start:5916 stop:6164 length:249 start_codon:yes stop_codon:yes gene_type:complete
MLPPVLELTIGLFLITLSILIFLRHKMIWERYIENYKPRKSRILNSLLKPYNFVYYANLYGVAPAFMILGAIIIYKNAEIYL